MTTDRRPRRARRPSAPRRWRSSRRTARAASCRSVHIWGEGDEGLTIFHETSGRGGGAPRSTRPRRGRPASGTAGFGWLTGPVDHGGRGLPVEHDRCYRSLEAAFAVADVSPLRIGLSTVEPRDRRQRHRRADPSGSPCRIQQGRRVACQLFSEPEAGSDLANVTHPSDARRRRVAARRARRCGPRTPSSPTSDWPSSAPIPTRRSTGGSRCSSSRWSTAGVEVRPLRQLTGGASFTEVFLDGAVVPDDHGSAPWATDGGWRCSTLTAERTSTGDRSHGMTGRAVALLVALARRTRRGRRSGASPAPRRRRHAAPDRARTTSGGCRRCRPTGSAARSGRSTSWSSPTTSAASARPRRRCSVRRWSPTPASGAPSVGAAGCSAPPGYRLGGGTDEMLKTMLGERLLGLPREPPMDDDAFTNDPARRLRPHRHGHARPTRGAQRLQPGHARRLRARLASLPHRRRHPGRRAAGQRRASVLHGRRSDGRAGSATPTRSARTTPARSSAPSRTGCGSRWSAPCTAWSPAARSTGSTRADVLICRRGHRVLRSAHDLRHGVGARAHRAAAPDAVRRGHADRAVRARRADLRRAGLRDRPGLGGASRRSSSGSGHEPSPPGWRTSRRSRCRPRSRRSGTATTSAPTAPARSRLHYPQLANPRSKVEFDAGAARPPYEVR